MTTTHLCIPNVPDMASQVIGMVEHSLNLGRVTKCTPNDDGCWLVTLADGNDIVIVKTPLGLMFPEFDAAGQPTCENAVLMVEYLKKKLVSSPAKVRTIVDIPDDWEPDEE